MFTNLEHELEQRLDKFHVFEQLINGLFVFEKHARLRRNQVHDAMGIKYWADKKLVGEKLVSMGVRKVITDGKRWFVGIAWKEALGGK